MSNTKLTGFYFPWPNLGIKLSRQWTNIRQNTEKEAPLIRAAYVDPQPSSANAPGEHDLAGWAIGERDFRNKFRIWYDKENDRFSIQYNSGTEAVEVWDDYLSIRQVDGRVTVHGPGGLDSSVGGFYSPVPRNMAVSSTFNPASTEWVFTHNLGTSPILWNAFNMEDKSVVPQTVDVSDPNTAYFYFAAPQSGRAIVTAEAARGEGIRVTDGTNVFDGANRLSFNGADFYLSNEGHGMPVVNLQPIDIGALDTTNFVLIDGSHAFTGDQSMGGNSLTDVATPVDPDDAATKDYVDTTTAVAVTLTNVGSPLFSDISKITFEQASFYLDTDSAGQPIVALRGNVGSGGGGAFGTGITTQSFTSSAEWQFSHNLNVSANLIWAVYNDQGEAIIPARVSIHNPNIAYFYFSPNTAGHAVIAGGPLVNTIRVSETDGAPDVTGANRIEFNSDSFYLELNSAGQPIVNFRGSSSGGGGGVTDHGALTGLSDDDHAQYLLASDATSRAAFAANWIDLTDGGSTSLHTHPIGPGALPDIITAEAFYLRGGGELSNDASTTIIAAPVDLLVSSRGTAFVEALGNIGLNTLSESVGGTNATINVGTGNSSGSNNAGPVSISGGNAENSGVGGTVSLAAGGSLNGDGGAVTIDAGDAAGAGDGGNVTITAGSSVSGTGGVVNLDGADIIINASANNVSISASGAGVVEIDGTLGVNIDGAAAGVLFNANILHNVGDPVVAQDAVTKNYLDLKFQQFYNNMGGSSGVTDHGDLTGLADDDHPQYLLRTQMPPGFYGVNFRETDGSPIFRNDTIYFDSASFYLHPNSVGKPVLSFRGSSGAALTVRDIDGNPTVTNVSTIQFTNGSVADQGGGVAEVTLSSGISSVTDGVSTYSSPSVLALSNLDFYLSRGTGGRPVINLRQSLESLSGYLDFGVVGNVFLETFADHPSVISDIDLVCRSGSAIAGFYIVPSASPTFRDGTKVTGADPITISTSAQKIRPTGANTMAVGDGLKMAITTNGNAKGIRIKVHLRRV